MNVFCSVMYILSCLALVYALMIFPKSKERLNAIVWGIAMVFTGILFDTVVAGIQNWLKLPISIVSFAFINYAAAITIFLLLKLKKIEFQFYKIVKADIIFSIINIIVVAKIAIDRFGVDLDQFFYCNGDAARHLDTMLACYSEKSIHGMYFVNLGGLLLVDLIKDRPPYEYYSAFMAFDICLLLLSGLLFWISIREYAKTKTNLFIAMVISLAYMLAYPLNNMLDGTAYWGAGMLCVVFSIFCIKRFTDNKYNNWFIVIMLLLADCGLSVSYIQFVPAVFIGQAIYLCTYLYKEKRLFAKESWIYAFVVFGPASIMFIIYGLGEMLGLGVTQMVSGSAQAVANVNVADGRVFRDFYCQFLPLSIFVILYIINMHKTKENNEVIWILRVILLHNFVYLYEYFFSNGATYYYYKNYFVISFIVLYLGYKGILLVVNDATKQLVYTYLISLFVLWAACLSGIERYAVDLGTKFIENPKLDQLFQIYGDNRNEIAWDQSNVSYEQHSFYHQVGVFRTTIDEDIILVSNDGTWWWETDNYQYYYDMTGQFTSDYKKTYVYDADTAAADFIADSTYVSVVKSCNLYLNNQEFFDSFEVILENDYAKLIRTR